MAKLKRQATVREVDNGYLVSTNVIRPDASTIVQEYVVDSLPKLVKVIKIFFEPDIKED